MQNYWETFGEGVNGIQTFTSGDLWKITHSTANARSNFSVHLLVMGLRTSPPSTLQSQTMATNTQSVALSDELPIEQVRQQLALYGQRLKEYGT